MKWLVFGIGFVLVMPYEQLAGIRPGGRVLPDGRMTVSAGYSLLGRVVDGLGRPLDDKPMPWNTVSVEIDRDAPPALMREPLSEPFCTGIRAIDGLLTVAKGQRVSIMAEAVWEKVCCWGRWHEMRSRV